MRAPELGDDVERDGKGLTALELVVTMLIELGIGEDDVKQPSSQPHRRPLGVTPALAQMSSTSSFSTSAWLGR